MKKYIVTYTSHEDETSMHECLDLKSAGEFVKEMMDSIVTELQQDGKMPTILCQDDDGAEVYVPDTGIYYDWDITEIEAADYEQVYLITAEQGEWDDHTSTPLWTVPDLAMAQLICAEFDAEGDNKYKEFVKKALDVTAIDDISLGYREVPFLGSLLE